MDKFIACVTKGSHFVQCLLLLTSIHLASLFFKIAFALSTAPWDCGCRGLPLLIFVRGHRDISSAIIDDVNSVPLSVCSINGAPKTINILYKVLATSLVLLLFSGLVQENFVK